MTDSRYVVDVSNKLTGVARWRSTGPVAEDRHVPDIAFLWVSGDTDIQVSVFLVGVAGFEPATPSSRTRCATRLRYTP